MSDYVSPAAPAAGSVMPGTVRTILWYRAEGTGQADLEAAYHRVSQRVAGAKGLISNELLRSVFVPGEFAVASEWESIEAFRAWADDPAHRDHTSLLDDYRELDRPGGRYAVYEVAASYGYGPDGTTRPAGTL